MPSFSFSQALAGDFNSTHSQQWFAWVEQYYAPNEQEWVDELQRQTHSFSSLNERVQERAQTLVEQVRSRTDFAHSVDKLLQEYSLDNEEGVVLMCLAEALMRIPDARTADKLIADKISPAKWQEHLGNSDSLLVNASTWGLMLTGKVTHLERTTGTVSGLLKRLVNSAGEPVIRAAMHQAMKIMGKQFVLGRTIAEAIKNGHAYRQKGYTYSFDMLGEAALTDADADRYYGDYKAAIESLSASLDQWRSPLLKPTISIKLSALFPRYESTHESWVLDELYERLVQLAMLARRKNIAISIDAEEADRLELSLKLFAKVLSHEALAGWGELGIVVQAYTKRALPVLGYIGALAREAEVSIPVRLVKGAYWDSEIKWAQMKGQADYPVYTRKENTDLSYMICAQFLLHQQQGSIYPQFATHNAHTVAFVQELAAQQPAKFEFQRLHGMGDALYDLIVGQQIPVRIYAPVGAHKDLLPYLVRRLLENGANSSFVHRLVDAKTPINDLVISPVSLVEQHLDHRNSAISLPSDLFKPDRQNSFGQNIFVASERDALLDQIKMFEQHQWETIPRYKTGQINSVRSPYDHTKSVGSASWCNSQGAQDALETVTNAFDDWRTTSVALRADCLRRMGDLLEEHQAEFISLCQREAGKTLQDAIDEIREAVDFLRYYASEAERQFSRPTVLPGPTGESNEHYFEGRGVFVCISPWNFPLAIFIGQISAALVAGNTVVAKPAEATTLIACRAVELFHEAGIPNTVLACVPGSGVELGPVLLSDSRVAGVAFTGSTNTAKHINRTLAEREGAIATFIAETGGNNAMIVDSTALPEQVVNDAFHSAFASAGQRCSALRVLCVQDDIADRIVEMIQGKLQRWNVGDPTEISCDAGPVIDENAQAKLLNYIDKWQQKGSVLAQGTLAANAEQGYFVPPTLIEITNIQELGEEQFGPVLHLVRYSAKALDSLINDINAMGYGLTLGIHSRNEQTAAYIEQRVRVGNCYINRNQIGAVVGVQPFGGCGLSGTGPKAGGPNYLQRFATERTRTINTTAVGGNATLLAQTQGR
jgi:RHH-type proline utilization regulon transcriptional repressor/proline dehydrogenase/delta 1-pyrroline-5-carboxylate dehydrogenase